MTAGRYVGALRAYRIVRRGLPAFDGSGAFRQGGRWTTRGRYVIHVAETYALAVLESLVHFNLGELPPNLVYIEIAIPPDVSREVVEARAIAAGINRTQTGSAKPSAIAGTTPVDQPCSLFLPCYRRVNATSLFMSGMPTPRGSRSRGREPFGWMNV